ncbi:DUF2637 domain-containing protein [Rothia amarae]|uniref:DUF2637 domain-containing protein n=1 Tax=Rothia amarae TaxID=169480 RepID=UPI0031DB18F1
MKNIPRTRQNRINPDSIRTLWFTVILIGLLGLTSFMVSFNGLHDVAAWVGLPTWMRWAVPIFIDIAILAYSMAAVIHKSRKEPVGLTWFTLGAFTTISVVANAVHALSVGEGQTVLQSWIGACIAATAPVAVFAATEEASRLAFAVPDEEDTEPEAGSEERTTSVRRVDDVLAERLLEVPTSSPTVSAVASVPAQSAISANPRVEHQHFSDSETGVVEEITADTPEETLPQGEQEDSVAQEVSSVDSESEPEVVVDDETETSSEAISAVTAEELPEEDQKLARWVNEQIEEGVKITGAAAGRFLDVSDRTGRNRLNRLRELYPAVFEGEIL